VCFIVAVKVLSERQDDVGEEGKQESNGLLVKGGTAACQEGCPVGKTPAARKINPHGNETPTQGLKNETYMVD